MAKNSTEANGAETKTNLLMFRPEVLHLVVDEKHPLYDKRVHLPLRESMVRNIMTYGVRQAITVAKDPETGLVCVVTGRQRVKHTIEANRRLVERGDDPILVPGWVQRDKIDLLADVVALENEQRESDTPLGRAEKMTRLLARGRSEEQLVTIFGCTLQTVKNTLALLDCPKVVRDAVEGGQVNVGHALALSKLPVEEQREKLAALLVAGEGAKPHERARKQRAIVKPEGSGRKSVREIRAEAENSRGTRKAALLWVLGEVPGEEA